MVNVPWCHDCDRPDGLCDCAPAMPDQATRDLEDYHRGVVEAMVAKQTSQATEITALRARVAELEEALRGEALRWAMDEIDALANKLCGFAYPQAMMELGRGEQQDAYVAAVAARAIQSKGEPT